jgi:DNA-binding NarL/FixJ family response regulator
VPLWVVVSLRCLIVDDHAGFREEMRGLLQEEGMEVVAGAASGDEALQQISESRPDVVLIDIDLQGESGFDLVRRLRGDPSGGGPRVIMISTHGETEYADLIEASSAVGFLGKTELSAPAIRRMLCAVDAPRGPTANRFGEHRGT